MAPKLAESVRRIIVNTGNILSVSDITKKPGQNPTEEIVEALNITLKDYENGGGEANNQILQISRNHDDLSSKMSEQELSDLKIGLKLFLRNDNHELLSEALDKAFAVLNVDSIHNVVLDYHSSLSEGQQDVEQTKTAWKTLETYVNKGKINQIGLSDIEEQVFRSFYDWAQVKPSIIQINLSTCCTVPPSLQEFCKENAVQLLTHSDPTDILPDESIETVFGRKFKLDWALRFLVYIKCRGVLTTKGYLLSLHTV